jgi:hypothetical protein
MQDIERSVVIKGLLQIVQVENPHRNFSPRGGKYVFKNARKLLEIKMRGKITTFDSFYKA